MTKPAFRRMSGTGHAAPILFASPHSGRHYPSELRHALQVPLIDLQRTEDAFVDDLFSQVTDLGASFIAANYARSYIDLNRDPGEIDTSMIDGQIKRPILNASTRVEAGLGCLPKIGASGKCIYTNKLSVDEVEHRLSFVHDTYHGAIRQTLTGFRDMSGEAILIDCHSMPSRQPGRRALPDIILGDRFGASCTSLLIRTAERAFKRLGYSVARNAPYAGGYTTLRHGQPAARIHALQMEINRGLYLDEMQVEKASDFAQIQTDMNDIAAELTDLARSLARPALAAE